MRSFWAEYRGKTRLFLDFFPFDYLINVGCRAYLVVEAVKTYINEPSGISKLKLIFKKFSPRIA